MKKTKFAYLFATVLVAGTMGLTSCSEEGENLIPTDGKTTKVAISMSLAQQTRATADEVNMGTTIQDINNVVIVPFIGDVAQNIITMPKFTASTETNKYYKTATLAQSVNKFRVYGNLPGTFADNGAFVFPDLTRTNADAPMNAFYKPYDLYYYTEASTTGNIVQVAKTGSWESASWGNMTSNIGENTMILISYEGYAVKKDGSRQFDKQGISAIYDIIREPIRKLIEREPSITDLRSALSNKKIKSFGQELDCQDIVIPAIKKYLETTYMSIMDKYKEQFSGCDKVILAGGGSYILSMYIEQVFNKHEFFITTPNAEYSNARGYRAIGTAKLNKK